MQKIENPVKPYIVAAECRGEPTLARPLFGTSRKRSEEVLYRMVKFLKASNLSLSVFTTLDWDARNDVAYPYSLFVEPITYAVC